MCVVASNSSLFILLLYTNQLYEWTRVCLSVHLLRRHLGGFQCFSYKQCCRDLSSTDLLGTSVRVSLKHIAGGEPLGQGICEDSVLYKITPNCVPFTLLPESNARVYIFFNIWCHMTSTSLPVEGLRDGSLLCS